MNKLISFPVERLGCIEPAATASGTHYVYLETSMTEGQMFEALQMFLTQITGSTWDSWKKRIESEAA